MHYLFRSIKFFQEIILTFTRSIQYSPWDLFNILRWKIYIFFFFSSRGLTHSHPHAHTQLKDFWEITRFSVGMNFKTHSAFTDMARNLKTNFAICLNSSCHLLSSDHLRNVTRRNQNGKTFSFCWHRS